MIKTSQAECTQRVFFLLMAGKKVKNDILFFDMDRLLIHWIKLWKPTYRKYMRTRSGGYPRPMRRLRGVMMSRVTNTASKLNLQPYRWGYSHVYREVPKFSILIHGAGHNLPPWISVNNFIPNWGNRNWSHEKLTLLWHWVCNGWIVTILWCYL